MSYKQKSVLFVVLAVVLVGFYAIMFTHGTRFYNAAGLSTSGVDDITGMVIKIACAVPAILLTWAALAFRKQLVDGAQQGLG
jgi:hypothetical protein